MATRPRATATPDLDVTGSDHEWAFADVWLLAAIGVYGRPCSLTEVIASADWINHAILLESEVETALGRLVGAGLVRVLDEWRLELTDEGTELWSGGAGGDLHKHLDSVASQLAAFEPGATRVALPAGSMRRAIDDYQRGPAGDAQPS